MSAKEVRKTKQRSLTVCEMRSISCAGANKFTHLAALSRPLNVCVVISEPEICAWTVLARAALLIMRKRIQAGQAHDGSDSGPWFVVKLRKGGSLPFSDSGGISDQTVGYFNTPSITAMPCIQGSAAKPLQSVRSTTLGKSVSLILGLNFFADR